VAAYTWEVAKEMVSIAGVILLIAGVVALFVTGTLLPLWVGLVLFSAAIIVAQARVHRRLIRSRGDDNAQTKIVNVPGGTPTLVIHVHAGGQVNLPPAGAVPPDAPEIAELPPPAPDAGDAKPAEDA